MSARIAYVAGGRLYLKSGDAPPRAVESEFADAVRERTRQIEQRHTWKTEGRGARFMSGGLLWGAPQTEGAQAPVAVTCVTRDAGTGDLIYALETGGLSGICAWGDGVERRLLHGS